MHDGWVVCVQVLERLGGLLEVVYRERRVEPGAALGREQRFEVPTLDPVHRDDVAVVHEEVLTDEWQPRTGREREQEPGFGEQPGTGALVGHGPDLQSHLTSVEVIERADHLALSAPPHHVERLVPFAEKLCPHRGPAGRRSPSFTAPRATAAFAS